MKKILIFYASYGGGHLSTANSINEYLQKNYKDAQIELIDCMKYVNKAIEKVTTAAYREMSKRVPWAWGKIYSDSQKGPLAHLSTRANKVMAIKLLKLLREKNPDIIISTHPFGSQMCSYLKRKGKIHALIATIMTDFSPHDQWLVGSDYTDYYFVSNEKMKKYLVSKNIEETKVFVTGIPISSRFLQAHNDEQTINDLGFSNFKPIILFFGGGEYGLGNSHTLDVFECLVKNFDNHQIIAIAGKNEKIKNSFEGIVNKYNKKSSVKVLGFTNKVPEFMSISTLVITKPGGLTTSESLASNLPIIVINPIPGQEEENAEFLVEKQIAIWIKKDDNIEEALKSLLLNPEKIEQMRENTKLLSKKYSTENICNIILKNEITN